MARAIYRQRPDGIFQIVRHRRWREAALGFLPMLAAFALVAALSAAITLYMVIALPLLAGVGAFVLYKRARRSPAPEPEPPASLPARTATLHRLRDAGR